MDQRLKYEQLVAGKLESLPVPDMEDMIWARVRAQLDLDLPEDNGDGNGPAPKPAPGIIGWGLSLLLITMITIFLINKNNKPAAIDISKPEITEPVKQTIQHSNSPPFQKNNLNDIRPDAGNKSMVIPADSPLLITEQDAVLNTPVQKDSSLTLNAAEPFTGFIQPNVKDSIPDGKKKGKGVQLKDEDYRVIPKKDND